MVKKSQPDKIMLAIGDGANDVNMITNADVGVGIRGREGQQAARSADYAIGQFSFLRTLLFVHGREAYRRNSYLINYMFYKNILLVMPQFFYGFRNVFSGQTLFEQWIYQLYNILFTCFPIIWFALYDYEFPKSTLYENPHLYSIGPSNEFMTKKIFWRWIIYGTSQGVIMLYMILDSFENTISNKDGQTSSFWVIGILVYSSVTIIANVEVMFHSNQHTLYSFFLQIASILLFFFVYYIESETPSIDELFKTFHFVLATPIFYVLLVFIVIAVIIY